VEKLKISGNTDQTWNLIKEQIGIPDEYTGYVMMIFTDRFELDRYPMKIINQSCLEEHFNDRLLDLRIFNESSEYRIFRSGVGSDFYVRIIDDQCPEKSDDVDCNDYFDDEQYLDIDTVRSKKSFNEKNIVYTTRGGCYYLPLLRMEDAKVKIRNYIAYEETGQAYVKDWRLAGFSYDE
jgi:hypothetical protein